MSRIGKKPILLDKEISINKEKNLLIIKGEKGEQKLQIPDKLLVEISEENLTVKPKSKNYASIQGLYRSLIQNAITGVKEGWSKTLELIGVGYRAQVSGSKLVLNLGFAKPREVVAPEGISFQIQGNKITVRGIDKYLVGEVAAIIRRIKPPEPYKGKGIKYENEYIRKKAGKAAKAVGGATAS